jgi:hypothetical protein
MKSYLNAGVIIIENLLLMAIVYFFLGRYRFLSAKKSITRKWVKNLAL